MSQTSRHLDVLRGALHHARDARVWIVVVAPEEGGVASLLGGMLVGICPREASVAGSTVLFPEGGRVTVVRSTHQVQGDGYFTTFHGFESTLLPADEIALHVWKTHSKGQLTFGGGTLSDVGGA